MKKIVLALTLLTFGIIINAQVSDHAIGIRGDGGNYGGGAEISYQHKLSDENRLELDLGFRSWGGGRGWGNDYGYSFVTITGVYQWVKNIEGGLSWFVGPGAQISSIRYSYIDWDGRKYTDSYIGIGIGGQLGIEYDFNEHGVPFQASLDTRPMLYFYDGNSDVWFGGALSVRYTF
ncbi:MAG: hypothetical protein ACLGGV_08975 [Bacteroidia bacterium]